MLVKLAPDNQVLLPKQALDALGRPSRLAWLRAAWRSDTLDQSAGFGWGSEPDAEQQG